MVAFWPTSLSVCPTTTDRLTQKNSEQLVFAFNEQRSTAQTLERGGRSTTLRDNIVTPKMTTDADAEEASCAATTEKRDNCR